MSSSSYFNPFAPNGSTGGTGNVIRRGNSAREDAAEELANIVAKKLNKTSGMMEVSQDEYTDDPALLFDVPPKPSVAAQKPVASAQKPVASAQKPVASAKKPVASASKKSNDGGDGGDGDNGGDDGGDDDDDDSDDSDDSDDDDDDSGDSNYEGEADGKSGKRRRSKKGKASKKDKGSKRATKKPRVAYETAPSEHVTNQLAAARARVRTLTFNVESISNLYFKKRDERDATITKAKSEGLELEDLSLNVWRKVYQGGPRDLEILTTTAHVLNQTVEMLQACDKLEVAEKNKEEAEAQLRSILGENKEKRAKVTRAV